jgi:hypothetical protein
MITIAMSSAISRSNTPLPESRTSARPLGPGHQKKAASEHSLISATLETRRRIDAIIHPDGF